MTQAIVIIGLQITQLIIIKYNTATMAQFDIRIMHTIKALTATRAYLLHKQYIKKLTNFPDCKFKQNTDLFTIPILQRNRIFSTFANLRKIYLPLHTEVFRTGSMSGMKRESGAIPEQYLLL